MSKTLYGTVEIVLGDETYILKPTLAAVRSIEAHFGGLRGASQAVNALSVVGCAVIKSIRLLDRPPKMTEGHLLTPLSWRYANALVSCKK